MLPADVGDLSLHEEMLDAAQKPDGDVWTACSTTQAFQSKNAVTSSTSNQTASIKTLPLLTPARRSSLLQAFSKRLLAQPKPEAELPHRSIIFVSSINAIMLAR